MIELLLFCNTSTDFFLLIGINFNKDFGQHILKNPLVVTSMVEKVSFLNIKLVLGKVCTVYILQAVIFSEIFLNSNCL